jgi:hypothetical protein
MSRTPKVACALVALSGHIYCPMPCWGSAGSLLLMRVPPFSCLKPFVTLVQQKASQASESDRHGLIPTKMLAM